MHLFIFRSEHAPELSCYCSDARGAGLPERFAPWAAVGVLRQDQDPPNNLSRAAIEAGVTANGYQLMRAKPRAVRKASKAVSQ